MFMPSTKLGSIILFKEFDEGKAVYDGEPTVESIQKFVTVQSMPLIVDFNHNSAQKIFGGDIKSHLMMFISKEAGHIEKYATPVKDLAKELRIWPKNSEIEYYSTPSMLMKKKIN